MDGIKLIMDEQLNETQQAQLDNLRNPIAVEVMGGVHIAGEGDYQLKLNCLVIKTSKSQKRLVMELLAMLPSDFLGNKLNIVPLTMQHHMKKEIYTAIVAQSVKETSQQLGIPIQYVHPSVFVKLYNPVETQGSIPISIDKFLLGIGVISIKRTKKIKENGRYILIVQNDKQHLVRQKMESMFETIKDRNFDGAQIGKHKYGFHPIIHDQILLSGNAYKLA